MHLSFLLWILICIWMGKVERLNGFCLTLCCRSLSCPMKLGSSASFLSRQLYRGWVWWSGSWGRSAWTPTSKGRQRLWPASAERTHISETLILPTLTREQLARTCTSIPVPNLYVDCQDRLWKHLKWYRHYFRVTDCNPYLLFFFLLLVSESFTETLESGVQSHNPGPLPAGGQTQNGPNTVSGNFAGASWLWKGKRGDLTWRIR